LLLCFVWFYVALNVIIASYIKVKPTQYTLILISRSVSAAAIFRGLINVDLVYSKSAFIYILLVVHITFVAVLQFMAFVCYTQFLYFCTWVLYLFSLLRLHLKFAVEWINNF